LTCHVGRKEKIDLSQRELVQGLAKEAPPPTKGDVLPEGHHYFRLEGNCRAGKQSLDGDETVKFIFHLDNVRLKGGDPLDQPW
jgi:hypothetical protein